VQGGDVSARIFAIVFLAILMAIPVFASQMALDLSELVNLSQVIVTGQVLAEAPFVPSGHQVETEVQVQVDEVLLGDDTIDQYIRVVYPGGYIPDYQYSISITDMPSLQVGEKYFLFLIPLGADNYQLVSPQGAVKIGKETVSYNGTSIGDFRDMLQKCIDQKKVNLQKTEYELGHQD
jgi:hypothetical protein